VTVLRPQEVAERRRRGEALRAEIRKPDVGCAVLATFNLDPLGPLLVDALDRIGVRADVYQAPFGRVAEEILDERSRLYAAAPDAVIVVPAVEDVLAPLFAGTVDAAEADAHAAEQGVELQSHIEALLDRLPTTTCYVVAFGPARAPVEAVLSPTAAARGYAGVERFLADVRRLGDRSPRVVVVDWDWRERRHGVASYRDDRLWYLARMRLNPPGAAALADLIALHVDAVRGGARKVAAVDVDDTLWGGVVGEVGLGGIDLGEDGIGLAYQDFQRELLRLRGVGVVLALCSKNNPEDVQRVFETHPAMVLRREHFAAERVNWEDKAANLRELAAELNVGVDSFVFLDDNPVERSWIRHALPDVLVPEVPTDPVERPSFLARAPFFARVDVTASDRSRADSYAAERQRREARTRVASFDDFLASLDQQVTIAKVTEATIRRAAQLTERTNQFNLTTRRYSAAEIDALAEEDDFELHTIAVRDRFGDGGIVGLAIVRYVGDEAIIDTFLLSCRVLGRRIEDAFLAFLADAARSRGARLLVGVYVPTPKNAQVANLYADRGFEERGDSTFALDLAEATLDPPEHIAVTLAAHA